MRIHHPYSLSCVYTNVDFLYHLESILNMIWGQSEGFWFVTRTIKCEFYDLRLDTKIKYIESWLSININKRSLPYRSNKEIPSSSLFLFTDIQSYRYIYIYMGAHTIRLNVHEMWAYKLYRFNKWMNLNKF